LSKNPTAFRRGRSQDSDYKISVVISDYDFTENKFKISNAFESLSNEYSLRFNSDYSVDEIIDEIEGLIADLSNYIKKHKK
jgi:hypothetical protein